MIKYSLIFLFTFPLCASQHDEWARSVSSRIDKEALEWARKELRKKMPKRNNNNKNFPKGTCVSGFSSIEEESEFFVFISFSVPESIWLTLSPDLKRHGGIFVVRGLPNNSFSEFAKRSLLLKNKGMDAEIRIDPDLFEKYHIEKVPTFLVTEQHIFDKLSGSVSLPFAFETMSKSGDTNLAKQLRKGRK